MTLPRQSSDLERKNLLARIAQDLRAAAIEARSGTLRDLPQFLEDYAEALDE